MELPGHASQCTFWCRVLTDLRVGAAHRPVASASQCTFWCRVLTDVLDCHAPTRNGTRLNAPSGAGCLPTQKKGAPCDCRNMVSMHLLVPGAYRLVLG